MSSAIRWTATILAALCLSAGSSTPRDAPVRAGQAGAGPRVADAADLKTWWHASAALNASTPVADNTVRRSTVYDVEIARESSPGALYHSFVYMSVPRSGSGKKGYTHEDGAEFADEANLTMSWTSFLYGTGTWVHVHVKEGAPLTSAEDVTIRPTTLAFKKERVNARTIRILVPFSPNGHRFSVEFRNQQLTSYHHPSGRLTTDPSTGRAVHTEPRNAMLIFANPMVKAESVNRLVPDPSRQSIYYPPEGEVSNLGEVGQDVIYFRPGVYYMPWNHHARIRPEVNWIYLAPGSYVKGAFEFPQGGGQFRVTGFGVLSGEKYVYEPDRANGYKHRDERVADCHASCVKMFEFDAGPVRRQLTLHGITVAEPPYHSFVAYGYEHLFQMDVAQFKQVGGWYWQTDGLELYQDSVMSSSFFHTNDDALKLYANNLVVNDIVVWKSENGPVIQWGWRPRNINNVRVNGVDVIHNRMHWPVHNSCIVNSARHYLTPDSNNLANPDMRVTNMFLEDIRSEGSNLCAMRLYALSSWENIEIKNLWIEEWNDLDVDTQASRFEALSNTHGVTVNIGDEMREGRGLEIENHVIEGERIRKAGDNWRSSELGRLNFEPSLWNNWNAW